LRSSFIPSSRVFPIIVNVTQPTCSLSIHYMTVWPSVSRGAELLAPRLPSNLCQGCWYLAKTSSLDKGLTGALTAGLNEECKWIQVSWTKLDWLCNCKALQLRSQATLVQLNWIQLHSSFRYALQMLVLFLVHLHSIHLNH
jgi:hypothetical protein